MTIRDLLILLLLLSSALLISGEEEVPNIAQREEHVREELKKWGLEGEELETHPALHRDNLRYWTVEEILSKNSFTIPDPISFLTLDELEIEDSGANFKFMSRWKKEIFAANPDFDQNMFIRAVKSGMVHWVNFLLGHPKLNPNFLDRYGNGALHYAAAFGYTNITSNLLGSGKFDINLMNSEYYPAIEFAKMFDRYQVVKVFLREYNKLEKSPPIHYGEQNLFYLPTYIGEYPETNGEIFSKKTILETLHSLPDFQWEKTTSKIADFIYLGGLYAARDPYLLSALKIIHVLDLTKSLGTLEPSDKITYLNIPIYDETTAPLLAELPRAIEFIHRSLSNGGRIMIHCAAGISRSSSVLIAYTMVVFDYSYQEAFDYVAGYRPIIRPNTGFVKQIQDFSLSKEFKELQEKYKMKD